CRLAAAGAAEEVLHGGQLAGAGVAGDEDVVTALDVLDAEAELERLDGALLPHDFVKGFEFGGRLESKPCWIARVAKFTTREFFDHAVLLDLGFYRRCEAQERREPERSC